MSYVAKVLPASVVVAFLLFAAGAMPVSAQFDTGLDDVPTGAGLSDQELPVIIGNILGVALGLLGIVFLVLMLYAGFMWMTAGGNDDKVGEGRKWIISGGK